MTLRSDEDLDAAQVTVWWLPTRDVSSDELVQRVKSLLTEEEERRRSAFVFEKNRHEFLVTRGLALGVLSRHTGTSPRELRFVRNEYGRPELVPSSPLRFNLTNTVALVACAVSHGREVGVDAEPLDRADAILDLQTTVFTSMERDALARIPLDLRRRRAVELWTLKEAYIKARGLGMSLPVEHVELDITPGRPVAVRVTPPVEDDPFRWSFATESVEGHLVSVCLEVGAGEVLRPTMRRADLAALLGVGGDGSDPPGAA